MSLKILKRSIPKSHFRAEIDDSAVIDVEKRTVQLVWSTGYKGLRRSWEFDYYEALSMRNDHCDLTRLSSGTAPLCDVHNVYSNRAVIGVVEKAWIENGVGKAIVRFSKDEEADKIFQKVVEKVLRNISIGYRVYKYEKTVDPETEMRTYTAVRWEPNEISVVPVGFDPGAQIRTEDELNEVEIVDLETRNNEPASQTEFNNNENKTRSETNSAPQITETNVKVQTEEEKKLADEAKRGAQAEKQRQADIKEAVRLAKLDDSFAQELIDKDVTADEARKQVLEKAAQAQPAPVSNTTTVEVGQSGEQRKREAIEAAIIHRVDFKGFDPKRHSSDFVGMSMVRLAEELLGGRKGRSDIELITRAMSTSDLPLILANVAEKSASRQYRIAKKTFEPFTSKGDLRNYKEHKQVKLGDFSSLEKRKENGEFKYGSMGEEQEVAQLDDYGKILKLTKQMLINDDLQVLSNIISRGGLAAARLESKLVYDVLLLNEDMADGDPLFDSAHGNIAASGTVIDDAAMKAGVAAMRAQKTVDDEDFLDIAPKFLIVGPAKENEAKKFLSSVLAAQTSQVNIYANSVELIVENRISGNKWFLSADPNEVDTITLFKLSGQDQPIISTRENWNDSSVEFKVEHTLDAAAMDYRGLYYNAGN